MRVAVQCSLRAANPHRWDWLQQPILAPVGLAAAANPSARGIGCSSIESIRDWLQQLILAKGLGCSSQAIRLVALLSGGAREGLVVQEGHRQSQGQFEARALAYHVLVQLEDAPGL